MDDNSVYELCLGIFIVFVVFRYLYPGWAVIGILFGLAALLGAFFFLRGLYEMVAGKGTMSMWHGAAICFLLIVVFGGAGVVMSAVKLIIGAASLLLLGAFTLIFSLLALV